MQTGRKIAELRARNNMSQSELADRLFVSRDLVSKWENGRRRPSYSFIEKIADIFETDPGELMPRDGILAEELGECIPGNADGEICLTDTLNRFLGTLSERERQVFVGRYYFLGEISDISVKLGLKPAHVRVLLSRTRQKLKKYMEEELR